MNCNFCGEEIEQGAKFCRGCGSPVPQEAIKQENVQDGNIGQQDYQEKVEIIEPIPNVNIQKPAGIGKTNASAIILLILSIICCCNISYSSVLFLAGMILAIISLVKSKNAANLWDSGKRDLASAEIKASKKMAMIGWILFGGGWLVNIIISFAFFASGGFDNINNQIEDLLEEYMRNYENYLN